METATIMIPFSLRRILAKTGVKKYYGLNQLDRKVFSYINKKNGVFVEAGANNGVLQSNTLYLETCHNWSGLLVEPHPEYYKICAANRPKCIVENVILGSTAQAGSNADIIGCGLMSIVDGAMEITQQQLHLETGYRVQGIPDQHQAQKTFTVPVVTLSELLERHKMQQVDLLSLDVEGYEHEVLAGLDQDISKIDYILIETKKLNEVMSILGHKYQLLDQLSHHDYLLKKSV